MRREVSLKRDLYEVADYILRVYSDVPEWNCDVTATEHEWLIRMSEETHRKCVVALDKYIKQKLEGFSTDVRIGTNYLSMYGWSWDTFQGWSTIVWAFDMALKLN